MTAKTPSAPKRSVTITPNNIGETPARLTRRSGSPFDCSRLPDPREAICLWNGGFSPAFCWGAEARGNTNATLGLHLSGCRTDRRLTGFHRHRGCFDRDREVPLLPFCRDVRFVPAPWPDGISQRQRRSMMASVEDLACRLRRANG